MTAEEYLNSSLGTSEKIASADDFLNEQLGSSTEEPEPSGFLRQAADLPVQFAKGGLQGTRMFTDLLGAGNPISKKIAGGEDYLDALLSAESKKDSEESARILKAAEDKGVYDQVVAGLEALSKAPLETAFNVAGIAVPNLALGALGKAAQAGKAAITATQVGLGALQGAGSIKGQIYQAVQDELRSQGMDEETIHKTASEAQAYGGKNLDQILLGAGLGAAATRAEVILSRVISGAGKEVTDDVIKNTFKNGLFEAIPEAFQGGQEQIAQNKALQNIGVDVPTMRGVVSASTMEGVAGGAFGGVAGLTESMSATPQSISTKRNASPEAKAEAEIDRDSDIQAAKLSIPANDTNKNLILDRVQQARQGIVNLQESLDVLEPTDPKAQGLRLDISAKQKELASLEAMAGLSEPITEAERQQAELAKAIVEEPAPTEPLLVPSAPVEQVVTPPVEVAPLPVRTVEESIQNKDTFEFEGMRGAVTLEDGTAVFRPFGTNDKYEVPINPNQAISEIEGIQWVRKGQARQAPVEPTIPEVAAIVESQPQITEEEFNATEDDFQLPPSLIEIEKSPTLNAIADIFNTGESKIAQEGKRAKKVSATPEFYRQISPEQIDVANKQIDNALRIIDNLPVSEEQKQALAEPYLLIDQDISTYENNPEYKQYKASIRREVRPADQAVTLPETISEVEAGVKELKQRAARPTTKPVITKEPPVSMVGKEVIPGVTPTPITPAPVTEQAAPAEAPAPEVAPTPAVSETITEPVTPTRKEAKFPTMPSIEEQTAEKVYGGETGLYDPFAGVQKKRTKAEDPAGRRGTEEQIKNADEHAAEIGGTVLYQDGDISLIRGYSIWGGTPIYIVANKGIRSRIDISSYKGNLTTPEQKAQLVDIKNKIEAEDQASFNNKPFITFTDGIAFSSNVPSAIAGVLKGWKSLLNIKANLYVTTYEDAVADKDKFNGPHRVIGSAGLASSKTDGSIRKMPNGDFYIMFRGIPSRTKMLETLAHELGHLHEKEAFDNASLATKKMLRDEHDKWVKSQTGKTAQELVSSLRAVKTAKANLGAAEGRMADDLSAYWKSFGEWYADQVSRWAVSSEKPLTIVDKFFSKIAKALRDFYSKITNQGYLPNETFVKYLERTLREPERIVSEPITIEGELEQLSQQLGEKPSKTTRRTRIMGVEAGEEVETQEAIIARTKDLLRKQFDPTKVTEKNTTEAFRALGKLAGNRKEALAYAEELNDIGRLVDKSGAASEISMGAALFVNDLFEYSIRLAAEGDSKMLGIMMANINRLPTAMIGASDAGRTLAARAELKARFIMMGRAEQDAYTNYVAEFIYGPNPTKEQIQSIKDAYAAVDKTEPVTEQELTDEITAVGGRTGTDLVGKINEEFTKATEKGKEKRRTEEQELDKEYKKIQKQADAEIEKLAKIQSDTPSFDPAVRQVINEVRAIVANDLKQRPDMESKADWKSALIAKLQQVGVEPAAAGILADIVWRQHEINSLSRELSSINKAIEKGPISEIVKAIKDTPLEDQQKPNWRYEVMRDYLRKAGLPLAQAERIAKLMDISLQKRFTMAQEQAFTDAISKSAPWKTGDTRSRRAFQKVLQALRAGALDPARNVLSDMAALNGWTGFTPEQYKALLKNDAILSDPKAGELKKAEAYKAIQDVISKAKLPIRARNVIGQYYDAQALSGIPTLTVNAFSPIAFAMRNAIIEIGSGTLKGNPKAITNAATALVDSIKSWANTVAFSFKNNVTVYSNVDYIVNDDNLLRLYRRGVDQFKGGKTARDKADGVKNMMVGMMDYVRRILNALDYGAIASLQNQNISKYSMAVMKRQGMSTKEGNEMFAVMMKAKNDFYLQQIAIGTDKNKASILADEYYVSSWGDALTKAGVEKSDIKQAMDAAINDALSAVGRNRQSLDSLKDEATKLKDAGVSSMPALWLLESMANAANQSDNQILKLFSRVIYGFAIVPARVIRETAWFSPYGFVRFGYDAIAKKMGKTSPYAQSLGTDVQYSQRLNEAIAGTVALIALASLRGSSTDEPEEDEFKIVFTGNGPKRIDDPQFYDSWYKAGNKPNSMIVSFGKTKIPFNMMRGFEAFTWPAMMLGAVDDLEIRKKQKRDTNTNTQIQDASIVAGFVFDAALRRGPYAFTTKSLFGTYGDIGVEGVAKGLTFPAKTLIPVLGTSLASNLSNFINDPIDRRTLDGAVWSNIPFIGPAVAPKSLNAFGEPALSTDFASKMFKLGVPLVYDIPTDRESIKLHELVLKQGGGPSIPTRNQLAQRLDRQPTNKEYEMFVKEYGAKISSDMKRRYEELSNKTPEKYSKSVEKIGNRARDIAERKVRLAAKKP
jgi:hypothetical protein